MRVVLNIIALLMIFSGGVFFLQGINIIPGSFMTGQMQWAVYGGLLLVAGLLLAMSANRRRKP